MAGITHLNHSYVAAGRVAPAARWSAMHQVKPSFTDTKAITQPLTEGSS